MVVFLQKGQKVYEGEKCWIVYIDEDLVIKLDDKFTCNKITECTSKKYFYKNIIQ